MIKRHEVLERLAALEERVAALEAPRLAWFGRCEGIAQLGPFDSEAEAWKRLAGHDGLPAPGATVWAVSEGGSNG